MADTPDRGSSTPTDQWGGLSTWVASRQTGAKLFLILSIALLPLALIAVGATLQTTRVADAEARARLRVAADESARAIAIEMIGDMTALRVALEALGRDPADAPSCARVQGVFQQQSMSGTRFVITDRAGRALCGQPLATVATPMSDPTMVTSTIVPDQGVVLAFAGPHHSIARAFFPRRVLARLGTQTTHATAYGNVLEHDGQTLELATLTDLRAVDRTETMLTDLGIGGLTLRTSVRSAPISSSLIVSLLLPILMWAAAASIAWFVVDRLLVKPLRQLRGNVAAYQPGAVIDPGTASALPAQEIRELGETFRAISRTVALHEAGLAEGLVRQTKLTREVHHRVKNNLQVIASLINFHARAALSPDAMMAYGTIQRRVDALAVVHRNHFADVEENRGLNLRAVIGELAAGLRAAAPDPAQRTTMVLDMEPLLVVQDVAVAVAFLVTEAVELAMTCDPTAQIRLSLRSDGADDSRGVLRVVSRALVASDRLTDLVASRYGRIMEGLSRQLRSPLHHDPMVGAYEIAIAVVGRD